MADVVVKRVKMFDGDTNGVSLSLLDDKGNKVGTIILPRHIAIMIALEIKRAAEYVD